MLTFQLSNIGIKLTKRGIVGILGGWVLFVFDRCGCTLVLFMLHKSVIKKQVFKRLLPAGQCRNGKVRVLKGCPRKKFHFLASEMRSAQADQ